jgi:uncharacterized Rmd1/YagE family protein
MPNTLPPTPPPPGGAARQAADTLRAHAVLLGERIDHRALRRASGGSADPVRIALPDGVAPHVAAFAFRWGALVIFGADAAEEAAIIATVQPHASTQLRLPAEERASIRFGAAEDGIDELGVIQLRDLAPARLMVVADALAKSASLGQQEATLAETRDGMEPVVAAMRGHGRLPNSSRALVRSIGGALAARSRVATHVAADDKPDVLWDHPALERLHARLADEFELRERSAALERKLTLIGDSVQTLLSLIEARRSLGLEIAIATMIALEVGATLYSLVFK